MRCHHSLSLLLCSLPQLLPLLFTLLTVCINYGVPVSSTVHRYDGDKVLRVSAKDEAEWNKVLNIIHLNIPLQEQDTWREPSRWNPTGDIHVPARYYESVSRDLREHGLHYTIFIDDIQRYIDRESYLNEIVSRKRKRRRRRRDIDTVMDLVGRYPKLHEIMEWQEDLQELYPGVVTQEYIGKTYENRDMIVLKFGSANVTRPAIWIDSGIHAREWVAPATTIYIISQLLTEADRDPEIRQFVDALDWYFLIVANPDGYDYSHERYRLWRLNMRPINDFCTGVDLNRNWDFNWGGANSSPSPCSEIYRGPGPGSEPEVQNMVRFLGTYNESIKAYISLHSYTQNWFTRWAYSDNQVPSDHEELMEIAKHSVEAIMGVHGKHYGVGTAGSLIYSFSGGSPDWARGVANIKFPYLIELRDEGTFGFLLPPEQIIPTGQETWAGIRVVAREVIHRYTSHTTIASTSLPYTSTLNPSNSLPSTTMFNTDSSTTKPDGAGGKWFSQMPSGGDKNISAPVAPVIASSALSTHSISVFYLKAFCPLLSLIGVLFLGT